MADASSKREGQSLEDVTDATGRQMVDDIFEESRLKRAPLDRDISADDLAGMELPTDPYVGYHQGPVDGGDANGETLVIASASQQRRYLLKRFDNRKKFRAWQSTPVAGEKLRLLNVYRVMLGQKVAGGG